MELYILFLREFQYDKFEHVFRRFCLLVSYQVIVVTTHEGAPEYYHGAKVVASWRYRKQWTLFCFSPSLILHYFTSMSCLFCSFPCPWYKVVPLSLALSPRIIMEVAKFKPDIIHASSPGIMVCIIMRSVFCYSSTLMINIARF